MIIKPYFLWSGALLDQICDILVEEGLKRPQLDAGTGQENKKSLGRSTTVSFINLDDVNSIIKTYVDNANEYYKVLIDDWEHVQFATYKEGDFYGWHRDYGKGCSKNRKLSVSVQLSNSISYTGGDLVFKREGWDANGTPVEEEILLGESARKRGSIIVFPSNLLHKITPVESGVRHSLVQWYSGPKDERTEGDNK